MGSRDLVSFSRLVSKPIFASLGLKGFRFSLGLEGYRSRLQAYCLETLNTATTWLGKNSVNQRSCLLYLQVKNNKSMYENARKSKKFEIRSGDDIF